MHHLERDATSLADSVELYALTLHLVRDPGSLLGVRNDVYLSLADLHILTHNKNTSFARKGGTEERPFGEAWRPLFFFLVKVETSTVDIMIIVGYSKLVK